MALLLTASQGPELVRLPPGPEEEEGLRGSPVGIGPHVSLKQIRLIEKQASENKAFVLSGVHELEQLMDEIVGYLCDLAPGACPDPDATSSHCAGHCGAQLLGSSRCDPRGALYPGCGTPPGRLGRRWEARPTSTGAQSLWRR